MKTPGLLVGVVGVIVILLGLINHSKHFLSLSHGSTILIVAGIALCIVGAALQLAGGTTRGRRL